MATAKLQIYRCEICENIVEVLNAGDGILICCDEPMTLMEENAAEAPPEKHIPIIEETDDGVTVRIGALPHPMTEEDFIEWIEIVSGERTYRKFLKPGDAPQASFNVCAGEVDSARGCCSMHRLWKSK